jgi:hypothetical protein
MAPVKHVSQVCTTITKQDLHSLSNKKHTIEEYIGGMRDASFFFSPKGNWYRCHGDGKATTRATFYTTTQTTVSQFFEQLQR